MSKPEHLKILAIVRDFFVVGTCVILWAYWIATNRLSLKIQIKDRAPIETLVIDSTDNKTKPIRHEKKRTRPR